MDPHTDLDTRAKTIAQRQSGRQALATFSGGCIAASACPPCIGRDLDCTCVYRKFDSGGRLLRRKQPNPGSPARGGSLGNFQKGSGKPENTYTRLLKLNAPLGVSSLS